MYLLTAVYFESWKYESWEKEKTEADMEYYDWNNSISCKNIKELSTWNKVELPTDEYRDIVNNIWNQGWYFRFFVCTKN